jgi:hypothetical protein
MYQAALELCAGSDVVVAHFSSWYVKAAAVNAKVPHVAVHFYPGMVPSREIAPPMMPSWRWLNRISWALFERIVDLAFGKPASRFFASKGLPPVRNSLTEPALGSAQPSRGEPQPLAAAFGLGRAAPGLRGLRDARRNRALGAVGGAARVP